MKLRRRRFLKASAGLAAGAAVGGGVYELARKLIHRDDLVYELTGLASGSEAFARIGGLCLARHPEEASREGLLRALGLLDADREPASTQALADLVHARILRDLENDELVALAGWLLTRTEGRLYALGAL
jgi:hypothetical protein